MAFTTSFLRNLALARHVIYASLVIVAIADGYTRNDPSPQILGLLIVPWVLHPIHRRMRRRSAWLASYFLEWVGTLIVLVAAGASWVIVCAIAVIYLAANAALWGALWTILLVVCASPLVPYLNEQTASPWIVYATTTYAVILVLSICAIAHWQANQLVRQTQLVKSDNSQLARFLPRELMSFIRREAPAIERRWLTITFIDLMGFTQASQQLPAELLAELLNDYLKILTEHVEQWGGSVSKFLGDGLLCVFDAGLERHNAAVECVKCVSLVNSVIGSHTIALREQNLVDGFGVSIGVASGVCAVGEWGGPSRSDYTAIGTPVNLAKRLQGVAHGHGGVLVDAITSGLVDGSVSLSAPIKLDLVGIGKVTARGLV